MEQSDRTERTWKIHHNLRTKRHELNPRGNQESYVVSMELETVAAAGGSPMNDFRHAGQEAVRPVLEADLLKQIPQRDEVQHAQRLGVQVQEATRREALAAARIAELEAKRRVAVLTAEPGLGKLLADLDGELAALRAERADAAAERQLLQTEFAAAKGKAVAVLPAVLRPLKDAAVVSSQATFDAAEQALGAAVGDTLDKLLIAHEAVLYTRSQDFSLFAQQTLDRILAPAPGTEVPAVPPEPKPPAAAPAAVPTPNRPGWTHAAPPPEPPEPGEPLLSSPRPYSPHDWVNVPAAPPAASPAPVPVAAATAPDITPAPPAEPVLTPAVAAVASPPSPAGTTVKSAGRQGGKGWGRAEGA